ncbi:ABC transporter substrate-binding protein [Phyllobacterium myrsinacearum]|uniref:Peptide/nickel transport system substrate-binding protein n=1 Tax=Phyllobacterium myrsinacearum TaxID=28101 RepID=A0A839EUR2_9HYPH|nr:ABC transporter substrate-binding protein [Phyllobacterium myrsinacearum]MBA8881845.1 peptide/nickel transport system substrate-binding protein [Phyllobacterium myrsinacearum]
MLKTITTTAILSLGMATTVLASGEHYGGTLIFTAPYGSNFATLDEQASPNTQEELIAQAIHRALYSWDSTQNKPVLELAASEDVSSDGNVHTYHLRKNAIFHNGKPLTADDIVYSYKRIANPKNAFPGASYIAVIQGANEYIAGKSPDISGLKKIDENTLEITYTGPIDPGFSLMQNTTAIYPSNVKDESSFATHPVGLGPFVFKAHVPGSQVVVEKFDKYYKEGKPYLDHINIVLMAEDATRDVAFRNKEIDVSILGPTHYEIYQKDPALKDHLLEVAEVYTRGIGLNPALKPFQDKRVRQAINYAINTPLIVQRLIKNKAYPATGWLPLSSPAFDKNKAPYAFDPAKAKALLTEAGYPDGFEFEVTASPNESWGVPIVEAILPMLKKVGITVKPKPVESTVLGDQVTTNNFQSFLWSIPSGPDPLSAMRCFYSKTPQSACNFTSYASSEFDKLFEAAEQERDPSKQSDLLREANNLVQDDAPYWFFNYNKAVMAYQPWVHGLVPDANELAIQPYDQIWIDEIAPASRK